MTRSAFVCALALGALSLQPAPDVHAADIALRGAGPTNVCFGAPGEQRLYVTDQGTGAFEVHEVGTDGVPLLRG